MKNDTTITPLHQPGAILDPLTAIARDGARRMLMAALKAEAASFVAQLSEERLPDGRQRVVLHGAGPERTIQTGPDRDRRDPGSSAESARPGDRRSPRGEDPLHLEHPAEMGAAHAQPRRAAAGPLPARRVHRRLPGGADSAARGADAPNLSPGVIARLTAGWEQEYDCWRRRDLSARRSCRSPALSNRWRSRAHLMPTGSICRPGWSRRRSACW